MTLGELRELLADVPDQADVWLECDVDQHKPVRRLNANYSPANGKYGYADWTVTLS